MTDLDRFPELEAALRRGLADLVESAPLPSDEQLDALESRARVRDVRDVRHPRAGRHLALAAAIVLVIAGVVGAVLLQDRDDPVRFQKVGGRITTSTAPATTTAVFGPLVPARELSVTVNDPADPDVLPTGLMNVASDTATLTAIWADAGLAASAVPDIDFDEEVVIQVVLDDVVCPSPDLEFRLGPAAVRAAEVEPATCNDPLARPVSRTYVYALRRADIGGAANLDVVDPRDPNAFGSVPLD